MYQIWWLKRENEARNAKIGQLIKRLCAYLMRRNLHIIELVWDFRTMNILSTFENDPRKNVDARALTVISSVRSWKMQKIFVAMTKPGTYVN